VLLALVVNTRWATLFVLLGALTAPWVHYEGDVDYHSGVVFTWNFLTRFIMMEILVLTLGRVRLEFSKTNPRRIESPPAPLPCRPEAGMKPAAGPASPRYSCICRVVALPAPSDREKKQWYFQRYVPHLPAAGEIVLFDRSWYNRAGVERVMGFADEQQVEEFFRDVPEFERMLVRSGIIVIKYWFSITDQEQQLRFLMRIHDPLKQWKLSPMDLQSRVRWEQYTKAKEEMFERTNIPEAPWYIVEGNDKKRARLNCISHLLSLIPYEEVPHEPVVLPERVFDPHYERRTLPPELYVPDRY
jgi:polyphosphate kinase 2